MQQIPISPEQLVFKLLEASRSEGLETAVQACLDLTHHFWQLAANPGDWAVYAEEARLGNVDWSPGGEAAPSRRLAPQTILNLVREFDVIPARHPQDETLREYLHLVFEELLEVLLDRVGRAGAAHSTRKELADLMASLVGDGPRLLDPACGLGSSLIAAARRPRQSVTGIDIDRFAAQTAGARFELAGISANIATSDWLTGSLQDEWDSICLEPPFSTKMSNDQLQANSQFNLRLSSRSDMVWLLRASRLLSAQGTAVVLLPIRTLESESDRGIREELLGGGLIEAIIELPGGASFGSGVETCLWVLRGSDDLRKAGQTLLINGGGLFEGKVEAQDSEVASLSELVIAWRERSELLPTDDWRACLISHEDLRKSPSFAPSAHLNPAPVSTEPRPPAPVRMLSKLELSSFKSVDDLISIPLRPLTLIYGRNSAGKSSLIQAMLLLRQSIRTNRLSTKGDGFDLGSFKGIVHRHDATRELSLGLSFGSLGVVDSALGVPNPRYERSVRLSFKTSSFGSAMSVAVTVEVGPMKTSFHRSAEEEGAPFLLDAQEAVNLVRDVSGEGFAYPSRKSSSTSSYRVRRALTRLGIDRLSVPALGSVPGPEAQVDQPLGSAARKQLEESYLRRGLRATGAVIDELTSLMDRLVYLGPLRRPPQRTSVRRDEASNSTDLPFFLLDNVSERDQVSDWMKRLGIDYDLDVLNMANTPGAHVLGDIVSVVLRNDTTGVVLSTADVGFGVSQVLPILVEMSARRESVIVVEQPEIHLHPAMQSELADLLIESIDEAGRANQIIAETHSEHLMLRVQRRIRERQLDVDQVAVIYVDQDEKGAAVVKELRLNEDGDFVDEWPQGFFTERFDEVFSGLL